MSEPTRGWDARRAWQTVFLTVLAIALLVLAYRLRAIFTPLIVAFVLAYIANPPITALERRGVKRGWSIAGLYVVILGALALTVLVGVPMLAHQAASFAKEVFVGEPILEDHNKDGVVDPGEVFSDLDGDGRWDAPKIARILDWAESRLKALTGSEDLMENLRKLRQRLAGSEGQIATTAGKVLATIAGWVTASIGSLITALSFVLLVPVYLYFLLKNMNQMWDRAQALIPAAYRQRVAITLIRIHHANAAFFRGAVTIALIEGTILFLGLTVLGVRFSLLFAAMYAVLALIPFVGVTATFLVTALFVLADTGGFSTTFLLVVGLFALLQTLEGVVLQPYILGKETGLHPVAVILSIFIFGDLFGFFGLLLAVPLASATIILVQDYLMPVVQEVTEQKASP
ncbi:MAG: AI-2E family transporter [Planctomycetes bacterium]|nr:AI-2E family transporter [Planctomycetota bacterium]